MDKSSANGGPPSYATASASTAASASAPTPTTPNAAANINGDSSAEQVQLEDLPRGVTLKEVTNPASIYNYTKVSLELPLITASKRIPCPPAQSAPLPPFLLHCTLFASYDINAPHPVPFRQSGCPATHTRGQPSATSKNKVSQSVSKLRKRLGVQLPVAYMGSVGFNPSSTTSSSPYTSLFAYLAHPQPRNGAEMTARSGNISRYRRVSLFQAQAKELTGIVSRPLVERVLSAIYAGQGIYDKMAVFPAEAVLRYSNKPLNATDASSASAGDSEQKTGWLAKLKGKAKAKSSSTDANANGKTDDVSGSQPIEQVKSAESVRRVATRNDDADNPPEVRSVKTAMVFATLDLLAPPPRLLETGGPYPIEMNKASDADLATSARLISEFDRGTDDERFHKFLFAPTPADEQLCADMLRALERRGAIWVEAGRLITSSSRNPNPRERARFLVKGLFPERFVYRCKYYRGRKFEPMPSDLDAKEVKKFGSPLTVHLVPERTGNEGIDLGDYLAEQPTTSTAAGSEEGDHARLDWEFDDEDNITFNNSSAATNVDTASASAAASTAPPPDYTSTQKELLKGYGIESQRAKALIEAEQDFFYGWSIGVTEEPFKNGGWMESIGTGSTLWFAASGI
ncbi:uncharacterized protein SRS1_13340 [Sporisorium reilianum f. sp. reilianum]|uniref:Uncharacterized protein n=1 Tax=Sporisorium reilianum f. sp. reilianum TaxID=72559 RepID=A0A2N8UCP4_9BASI|nr:uncharacterized protein SRS1_13340 [Sporisorium reilianum f. sp. reilianum]